MSRLRCAACGDIIKTSWGERNFLLESEPFICSADCLIDMIHGFEPRAPIMDYRETQFKCDASVGTHCPQLGLNLRSNYERDSGLFLFDHGIPIEYEKYEFQIGTKLYIPDFYNRRHDVFIEIKGMFGSGAKPKLKKFRELYPQVRFIFVSWIIRNSFNRRKGK